MGKRGKKKKDFLASQPDSYTPQMHECQTLSINLNTSSFQSNKRERAHFQILLHSTAKTIYNNFLKLSASLRTFECHTLLDAFISSLFLSSSYELNNVKAQWGGDLSKLAELQDVTSHCHISNEMPVCAQFLVVKYHKNTLEWEAYHCRNRKHSRCTIDLFPFLQVFITRAGMYRKIYTAGTCALFLVRRTVRNTTSLSIWIMDFCKHFCILKRVNSKFY